MGLKKWFLHLTLSHARNKAKKKGATLGQKHMISRGSEKDVETYLYAPKQSDQKPKPVLFNVHGGAWVGGDATLLDTQSQLLADTLGCFVVNINYRKADEQPFPYQQNEVRDTVLYFKEHAAEYGLDVTRFTLIGYSAGGHICAGTALLLRNDGFALNSQFLCYPFLTFADFDAEKIVAGDQKAKSKMSIFEEVFFEKLPRTDPIVSPASADPSVLTGVAPVEILTCGQDMLFSHATLYEEQLKKAGVPVERKDFEGSIHGFLETNFPETKKDGSKSEEQEAIMREAVAYIRQRAFYHWNIKEA